MTLVYAPVYLPSAQLERRAMLIIVKLHEAQSSRDEQLSEVNNYGTIPFLLTSVYDPAAADGYEELVGEVRSVQHPLWGTGGASARSLALTSHDPRQDNHQQPSLHALPPHGY